MSKTKNKLTARHLIGEALQIRSAANGDRFIEGYAIVFGQQSKLLREWGEVFYEIIESSAVDNVLADAGINVIATVDHSRSKMLGRTKANTLQLVKDDKGLKYIINLPNTTLGNDMAEMISRGDYYESSFIFTVADKGCRYDNSGDIPIRHITNFENIYDVAIVVDGAYANTEVGLRSQEFAASLNNDDDTQQEPRAIVDNIITKLAPTMERSRAEGLSVIQLLDLLENRDMEVTETESEKVARMQGEIASKDKEVDKLQRRNRFLQIKTQ